MKAKEFIPAIKPRNFVAKNAQSSGAGRHQDSSKKKDQDQGKVKHKKDLVPMESAPKGWEGTVKAMKKHKDIDNPYALAWSMKNKGYKSHKKEGVAEGAEELTPNMAKYVLDQIYNSHGDITMTDLFDEGIPGLRDMFMATAEELGLDPDEDFIDVESAVLEKLEDLISGPNEMSERVRDPEDWDEGNTEPGNNFAVYINGKKWKVFPGPAGAYADSPEEKREFARLQAMAQRKSQESGKKWEVYVTGEPATR